MSEYLVKDYGNITNTKVYGLDESIVRAKYPMSVDISTLNSDLTNGIAALANCEKGTGHDQWLTGVIVQFDLTYTIKAWTEAERTGGEEDDERNNRIRPLGPYRPSARRMVNGTQHIFDNTQDSSGCHIRVSHRLRAFEQASLGGTAHFRAHLLCLDRLDDT